MFERIVGSYKIKSDGSCIKGTNAIIYSLYDNDEYLGIMKFHKNQIPDNDEELKEMCDWKKQEELK